MALRNSVMGFALDIYWAVYSWLLPARSVVARENIGRPRVTSTDSVNTHH
jgi:hypothetical protein